MRHSFLIPIFAALAFAQTPAQLMDDPAVRAALDAARRNEPHGNGNTSATAFRLISGKSGRDRAVAPAR